MAKGRGRGEDETQAASAARARRSGRRANFSEEERAAMRERLAEIEAEARGGSLESAVLDKIASMPEPDRAMASRVHAIVRRVAPHLEPKLWYGMPAYAKAGKVVVFFQGAFRFKSRYATLGFSDEAALDEGQMWPVTYALASLGPAEEARIADLVRRAVGAVGSPG